MGRHDSSDCPDTRTKQLGTPVPARRAGLLTAAMSLALLTAAGAAHTVASTSSQADVALLAPSTSAPADSSARASALSARAAAVALGSSRSQSRAPLPTDAAEQTDEPAEPEVIGARYATVGLNVRKEPDAKADVSTVLDPGDKIRITDVKEDGWRQVVYKDKTRWVKGEFLAKSKPKPSASSSGGLSTAPCASGSGVEGGLGANATAVHRAVCARYPQVNSYGGYRPGSGNHSSGRALDIMVSGSTGVEIANWLRANAAGLGITEVIHAQQIWTTQRAGDGWRAMSDRGSATANHYDHVHVTVR